MEERKGFFEEAREQEKLFQLAVKEEIESAKRNGFPVARYDLERKQPFLEYPDGRREYNVVGADD